MQSRASFGIAHSVRYHLAIQSQQRFSMNLYGDLPRGEVSSDATPFQEIAASKIPKNVSSLGNEFLFRKPNRYTRLFKPSLKQNLESNLSSRIITDARRLRSLLALFALKSYTGWIWPASGTP